MLYEYSGYLKTVLQAPDPDVRETLPCVLFTADDIAQWNLRDQPFDMEWQHIPASLKRSDAGAVRLEGRFNDVRQLDNLSADDPSFWVALSTLGGEDGRFPVDVTRYPIAEITYRCLTPNARPAWQWVYPDGVHFDGLTPVQEWRTIARRVQHFGFPDRVDAVIVRLYSTARSVESMEIDSIRFREMSLAEAEACQLNELDIDREVKRYPILDEFLPFGCHMDAGTAKRLASMLGVSLSEYWSLVLEDIARHHHNCVALEQIDRMSGDEWKHLLEMAESYRIRFFAIHQLPLGSSHADCREFIDTHVRPYAKSPSILAWGLYDEPPEHAFDEVIHTRDVLAQEEPDHPMALLMRDPNSLPLFAPFLPIVGMAYYGSHVPWRLGDMVRAHLPLCGGQQLWVVAPGFIYATDTPEWHSCPEMRLMMNHALANGARGWFTFAYHNDPIWVRGSCQRSLTGPFLTFSDLWSELGQRVEHCNALSPLFLKAVPAPALEPWFSMECEAHVNAQLPEGMAPVNAMRLCGPDFELFCILSNDIREMTSVQVHIARDGVRGRSIYDLSDYVWTRRWTPMDRKRHLEMFPGQMHVFLVAKPEVCTHWRDIIAERMIANDHRFLSHDLNLARVHGLNVAEIETCIESVGRGAGHKSVETMQRARHMLLDLVYDSPSICETRSQIIEASAAVCGCDGALCRLLNRGKVDQARQLGFRVIPLAREFTNLRLELRHGKGAEILGACQDLSKRAVELLAEIRAIT